MVFPLSTFRFHLEMFIMNCSRCLVPKEDTCHATQPIELPPCDSSTFLAHRSCLGPRLEPHPNTGKFLSKLPSDMASLAQEHFLRPLLSLSSSHQPVCVDKHLMGIDVNTSQSLFFSLLSPHPISSLGPNRVIRGHSGAFLDGCWGGQGLDCNILVGFGLLSSSGVTGSFF